MNEIVADEVQEFQVANLPFLWLPSAWWISILSSIGEEQSARVIVRLDP